MAEKTNKDRAYREWTIVGIGLTGLLSVLAIILSAVALASTIPGRGPTTVVAAAPATQPAAAQPTALQIQVKTDTEHGRKGPDGKWHDAFLPADFSVRAGGTVKITVVNYDGGPHSFTSPSMGVNQTISGGGSSTAPRTMTFTFTAPKTPGKYAWWCAVPCDPWAMAHDGFMRGVVTVKA
jgi:plastocyanin